VELVSALLDQGRPVGDLQRQFGDLAAKVDEHKANSEDAKAVIAALDRIMAENVGTVAELAATIRNQLVKSLDEIDRAAKSAGETLQNAMRFQFPGAGGPLDMEPLIRARERAQREGELAGTAYLDGLRQAFTGGQSDVEGFQRNFGQRLSVFIKAAAEQAGEITITSAHRTIERQAELFAEAVRKHGSPEAARKWVAAPTEMAPHVRGIAADLGFASEAVKQWAHDHAAAYGLVFRMSHEGWHVELADQEKVRESRKKLTAEQREAIKLAKQEASANQQAFTDELKRQADAMAALQQQMEGLMSSALSGFAHDLMAGKDAGEAFTNMVKNLTAQIVDMAIRMMIVKPLMNSLFGGFGTPGGLFEAGGTIGLSGRRDGRKFSPMLWAGAPRYASGGVVGLRPGEVPIIAHRGEIVVPNARRLAGGGGRALRQSGQRVDVFVSAAPSPLLDLSIQHRTTQSESRAIARGPAVARDQQRRYGSP
jgi:hypothetical protein